jgi:hypothetical protein
MNSPPIDLVLGITPEIAAPNGFSGEYDEEEGPMTVKGGIEATVENTFGNEFVDERLGLPGEFEGDNWFELTPNRATVAIDPTGRTLRPCPLSETRRDRHSCNAEPSSESRLPTSSGGPPPPERECRRGLYRVTGRKKPYLGPGESLGMERRRLLALVGGSASLGLAGCLGGDGGDGSDNSSGDNGDDGVGEPGAEANLVVEIQSATESVEPGESATVSWTVENTGDLEGTQTLVFTVDGNQEDSEEVTVDGGETASGEFSYTTAGDSEESVRATVESDNSNSSVDIVFGVEIVSGFSAIAESARAAIDANPEQYTGTEAGPFTALDTGEPLVELSAETFSDGNWESTQFDVPGLVDLLLGLDPNQIVSDLVAGFDIQADLVEAFTLNELIQEIAAAIEGFYFSTEQSEAAADLLQILAEEFELPAPSILSGVVQGILEHPDFGEDEQGGDPVDVIAAIMQDLIGFLPSVVDGLDSPPETVEDLLVAVTGFIKAIPNGEIDQILPFLEETLAGVDFEGLLSDFSLAVDPAPVSGTMESAGEEELLVTVPLTTVTVAADLGEGFSTDPPEIDLELDLELTTGTSGNLAGGIDLDTETDTADATVVENELTADLTEFDLVGLVEELNVAELLAGLFQALLGIDLRTRVPETFDAYDSFDEHVGRLDPVSLVEEGEPLGLVAGLITDEPGRHAVVADLAMEFDDLGAVVETV